MRTIERTIVPTEVALDKHDKFSCNINNAGNITLLWYNESETKETVIELNERETYEIVQLLEHIKTEDVLPF